MSQTTTVQDRLARMKAERAAAASGKKVAQVATEPVPELKRVRQYVPPTVNLYDKPCPKWRPMSGDCKIELDSAVDRMEKRMEQAPATFRASLAGQDYKYLRWFCLVHKLPIPRCNQRGGRSKDVFVAAIQVYISAYELQRETAVPTEIVLPGAAKRATKDKQEEQVRETVAEKVHDEEEREQDEPEAVGTDAWTAFETLCGEVDAGNDSPVLRLKIRRLIAQVVQEGGLMKSELPALQEELGLKFSLF